MAALPLRWLRLPAAVLPLLAACGHDVPTQQDRRAPAAPTPGVTAPSAASLKVLIGTGQKGTAGAPLRSPVVVQALDPNGRPLAGAPLKWSVSSGGGTLAGAETSTRADGTARAVWTMGSYGGPATVTVASRATVATVNVSVTGPAPVLAAAGGTAQAAPPGQPLAAPLVLKATSSTGAPLAGVPVSWSVSSGGGVVTPMAGVTGADGTVAAHWTLGAGTGTQTVTAAGPATTPVSFTAAAMLMVLGPTGSGQTATVGTTLPQPLVVRVTNDAGAPVPGVGVKFMASSGSGTVTPELVVTNANGVASTQWTLGNVVGTQSVTATVPGGPTVGFFATATKPLPLLTLQKTSGDNQVALPGHNVPQGIGVRAVDSNGNGVADVPLTFTASNGGTVSAPRSVTDGPGYAVASWVLGPTEGTQTLTVTGGGSSVTFTAVAISGGDVQSINFSVGRTWLDIGETTQLYASANGVNGQPVTNGASLSFTTDRPDLLQITSVNLRDPLHGYVYIKALGAGEPTLIVTAGSVTKTLTYRFFVPGTRPGTRPGDGGGGGSADRAPTPAP